MPKASGATSNRFQLTRGNSSERIEKPDVDEITGIAPAISIRQKNSTRNPRSTVATATEIYDYLRLLYARVGRTICLRCGEEVRKDTLDEIATRVLALPAGRRFYVLYELKLTPETATNAPQAPRAQKPARPAAEAIRESADQSAKARLQSPLSSRPRFRIFYAGRIAGCGLHEADVYVLVDRLELSPEIRSRLMDSIEICYREGRGEAILEFVPDEPPERRPMRLATTRQMRRQVRAKCT